MKRLLLIGLLSCTTVGQLFCAYNQSEQNKWKSTIRGVSHALTFPALFAGVGYLVAGKKGAIIGANVGTIRGHFYWFASIVSGKTDTDWNSFSAYVTTSSLLHFGSLLSVVDTDKIHLHAHL